jgi:hypothetical protein
MRFFEADEFIARYVQLLEERGIVIVYAEDTYLKTYAKNLGQEVHTKVDSAHCDMRQFNTEHICLYGPGADWSSRAGDERYRLNDMLLVAANLKEFAVAWCGFSGQTWPKKRRQGPRS